MARRAHGARAVSMVAVLVTVLASGACTGSEGSGSGAAQTSAASSPSAAPDTFATDTRAAIAESERFWNEQLSKAGKTFEPVSRIIPYTSGDQVMCGTEAMTPNNAAYCSDGDFIAFDEAWAQRAYEQVGDAFIYYLLAHEYAHAVQVRLGIRYEYTIEQELQADCMAGAMLGNAIRTGKLQLEDGDIQELKTGLIAVADQPGQPWFAEGSHGTAEQRTDAFFAGYDGSLDACKL